MVKSHAKIEDWLVKKTCVYEASKTMAPVPIIMARMRLTTFLYLRYHKEWYHLASKSLVWSCPE